MPVAYDSTLNTITVVGFSESSPCTFEDVYQASVNNGWGVVDKLTDSCYVFRVKLKIGDGSTWTYFADVEKEIVFTSEVSLDYHESVIEVTRHGYFWVGLGDEDTRTGHNGCVFDGRGLAVNSWSYFICGDPESDVRLYGSVFLAKKGLGMIHIINLEGNIARVWNCLIEGGGSGVIPTNYLDMSKVKIIDCKRGIRCGYQPEHPFTDIVVMYSDSCAVFFYADQTFNLFNTQFVKNDFLVSAYDLETVARFTDCEADEWTVNWEGSPTEDAKIERAYTFKVKITDKDGNPIQNALVELYDKEGNLVFAELTNANGEISEHSIVSITYTPAGTIDNNPYMVKVSKEGYASLKAQLVIDRTMKNLVWQLDALDYTLDEIMQELQSCSNTLQVIKSQTDQLQFDEDGNLIATLTSGLTEVLNLTLGLVQHNYRLTDTVYEEVGGRKRLKSAKVLLYTSQEDLQNDTNPIAVYQLELQYDEEGNLIDYRSVKL